MSQMFSSQQGSVAPTPATGRRDDMDKKNCLTPMTCKQIDKCENDSEGSKKLLFGEALTNVSIVGLVHSVDEKQMWNAYMIDDSTGMLEVKHFVEDNKRKTIVQGTYVKVIGKLQLYNGRPSISAWSLKPITSSNQVTHHLISVCHAYLSNKKYNMNQCNNMNQMGMGAETTSGNAPTTNGVPGDEDGGNYSPVQKAVYELVQKHQDGHENGAWIQDIMKILSTKGYDAPTVRNAITELTNDGSIYDTVDDEWVKTT